MSSAIATLVISCLALTSQMGRSSGRTAASGRMGVTSGVSTAWIARQWPSTWRARRHSGNGLEKHLT